ncbi:MAG: protein-L-isoaspartate(D-aspartate) O-methyltransferase [Rhodomicrobium sp.]
MKEESLRELLRSLQHNGISDPRVLDAIARTPREEFISDWGQKAHAYADEALPIECGQTISQPFIVAYMTERLHISADHDVLEIGTGSGYQAAILSRLARHVYTMECHLDLHRLAEARFTRLGLMNITAIHGDGTKGWPQYRLFDRIIVTAATEAVPEQLLDQLAPCGFMVIPLGLFDGQRITLITRSNGRTAYQTLLPVRFVPLVPEGGR